MSFMYPRNVAITRPVTQTGVGLQAGYSGAVIDEETPVAGTIDPFEGLSCSIQARREGQNNPVGLPADGTNTRYHIYIPKRGCAKGVIKHLDIVTDDEGVRYQVLDPGWDSLGHRMTCVLLTA